MSSSSKSLLMWVLLSASSFSFADTAPISEAKPANPLVNSVQVGDYRNKKDVVEAAQAAKAAREKARASANVKPGATVDTEQVKALAQDAQRRGRDEMNRLKREGQLARIEGKTSEYAAPSASSAEATPNDPVGRPQVEGRVVVALSSSMPREMVREYLAQLDNIPEAVVVLRGALGGLKEIKPTMKWAADMRKKDPTCERKCTHNNVQVIIDPLLYRSLKIDKVPAVAYLHGVQDIGHCEEEQFAAATVIYGATSVEAALKHMKKEGVTIPTSVMTKFESKSWERRKT